MGLQRTYPDNGVALSDNIAPDVDLAELAARLGSPMTWRRDGRVLSLTNFSPSMDGWKKDLGDPEIAVWGNEDRIYSGGASLHAWSTVAAQDRSICKTIPGIATSRIGLECMFCEETTHHHILEMTVRNRYNALSSWEGILRIDLQNGLVYYLNSAGAWILCYTHGRPYLQPDYHNFKLVVDFTKGRYVRAHTDEVQIPLNVPLFTTPIVSDCLYFSLNAGAKLGQFNDCYWDNVIITASEY